MMMAHCLTPRQKREPGFMDLSFTPDQEALREATTRLYAKESHGAGLLAGAEPGAVRGGLVEHAFRHAVVTTIYGGSSEVQREIIAGRALGLPRGR